MIKNILKSFFGTKADKDIKEITPVLNDILKAYETIKNLSNDELRGKTISFRKNIAEYIAEEENKIQKIKQQLENEPDLDADEKEKLYDEMDRLEKVSYDKSQEILNKILPEAFAVIKETARRFKENDEVIVTATDMDRDLAASLDNVNIVGDKAHYKNQWMAGGNMIKWDMVHYDVQLIGGIILHQGKIAEMGK